MLTIFIYNNIYGDGFFIENKGQWDKDVLYKSIQSGLSIYICTSGISYQLYDGAVIDSIHKGIKNSDILHLHHIKYRFLNSNINFRHEGRTPLDDYSNYFVGDKSSWASSARHFNKIYIYDLYDGVDVEYYFFGDALKYNLILKGPEKRQDIRILIEGAENIKLQNNEISIKTSVGEMKDMAPVSFDFYQNEVKTSYKLAENILGFEFDDQLIKKSSRRSMVIDPYLVFSTYSGSVADNFGYTATYDNAGNGYSGGSVYAINYPTTIGAYQEFFAGGLIDMAINKYTPNGNKRIYATYLGGGSTANREGSEDHPHSMVVNHQGNLVILGTTSSNNFPIADANTAFDADFNGGFDIVIATLSPDGKTLLSSTYIGGAGFDGLNGNNSTSSSVGALINNYADNFRGEVIVDGQDNIYIASSSRSADFPIINGQQTNLTGTQNAVILKLNAGLTDILWSTYWGGTGETAGYGITLAKNNYLYITGGTTADGMIVGSTVYQKTFQGGKFDGFIAKLNATDGKGFGSYIGTNKNDQSYLIQTDSKGDVYVYGQTSGSWPVTANIYNNPNSGMFITRLDSTLTNYTASMVFGSGTMPANLSPTAFLVDQCDRIFVSGWGGVTNASFNGGKTIDMPLSADALQKTTDGSDFYIGVFSKNMEELLYGTYFGGNTNVSSRHYNEEHVDGGTSRFDPKGIIYQSVCASCNSVSSGFPVSDSAWSKTNKGIRPGGSTSPGCNNALFKIDFENFNRKPIVRDSFFEVIATEDLQFIYDGYDPDRYDSVFITHSGDFDLIADKNERPVSSVVNGLGKSTLGFSWKPGCKFISKDTYLLKIKITDQGCPTTDSNFATIKVLVKPPPVSNGPPIFCLKFDDNELPELFWDGFTTNKYFKNMRLLRKEPDGSILTLQQYQNAKANSYKEPKNLNFTIDNYCYFFVTENICGFLDTTSLTACTVREYSYPIVPENVVLVTVEQDSFIKIVFNKSEEPDFLGYRLFRKSEANKKNNYEKIDYHEGINDTVFYDYKVSVDDFSYCYYVIVEDNCGHRSVPGDSSCSILLQGKEYPFYFTLESNAYEHWETGVKNYDVYSRVDTGTLRNKQILTAEPTRIAAKDADLDYDWGGYFYQYRANNSTNDTTPERVSFSNTIYLIQPPLLHVPSAFSPNGDGHNDVWGIVDVFVKTYQVLVFNRWGEKVYDSEDKNAQWNAIYKNTQSADNVYAWIAYYTGWDERKYSQKGNVTVVK